MSKEKLITVFGTRPEIIRLSCVIDKLDKYFDHKIINTYQNNSHNLNDLFLDQLRIRKPDYNLTINHSNYGDEIGDIISKTFQIFKKEKPDKLLVLGDTYSGLCVLPASNLGIKIYHAEAGMRSGDWRMPEEKNRRIIDHLSNVNLTYTEDSKENLMKENINHHKIHVIGNPIHEVLKHFSKNISSSIPYELGLELRDYYLVTIHRNENVTNDDTLHSIFNALITLAKYHKVVLLAHPRLVEKMKKIKLVNPNIIVKESIGFFDFLGLQRNAKCVLTDSGTVPEECAYHKVPCVILRDSTERPELVDIGSCIVAGTDTDVILNAVDSMLNRGKNWDYPVQFNTSDRIVDVLMGVL